MDFMDAALGEGCSLTVSFGEFGRQRLEMGLDDKQVMLHHSQSRRTLTKDRSRFPRFGSPLLRSPCTQSMAFAPDAAGVDDALADEEVRVDAPELL